MFWSRLEPPGDRTLHTFVLFRCLLQLNAALCFVGTVATLSMLTQSWIWPLTLLLALELYLCASTHSSARSLTKCAITVKSTQRAVTGETNLLQLHLTDASFSCRRQHAAPAQRSARIQGGIHSCRMGSDTRADLWHHWERESNTEDIRESIIASASLSTWSQILDRAQQTTLICPELLQLCISLVWFHLHSVTLEQNCRQ